MYRIARTLVVPIFSMSLLLLSGCFPTENSNNNPTPFVEPVIIDSTTAKDLPTDINISANTSEAGIDSMFNRLIADAKKLDNLNTPSDLYALDFTLLRKGFGAAINKSPNHVKANVGFIVSSVLSINGSKDIQKVVDSIDCYINNMDAYYDEPTIYNDSAFLNKKKSLAKKESFSSGFLAKTYSSHGLLSAGQALVAETPKILMSQTSRPAFPRFLTLSYIQNAIESDVIPRLDEVIAATHRLRTISDMSLPVTIDGTTTELDNSDILILEGAVRAARAGFTMMLIYDTDIYSPNGTNDMRWIDKYAAINDSAHSTRQTTYTLHSDTLSKTYYTDVTPYVSYISDVYQYNLGRSAFLSIRKNYHTAVYNDLKEVPMLFKAGLLSIKNEKGNQDNDLIPAFDISDMSEDMLSFSKDMLEEGFSPYFASKFESPEAFMDFISLVLSGPYQFNENIDNKQITITVDLSKFFTNPANSLKDYWPKYRIPTGNERYYSYVSNTSVSSWTNKSFYIYRDKYDSVQINIPASLIDSIEKSPYYVNNATYHLKNSYNYTSTKDSGRTIVPIIFLDDQGNSMNFYSQINEDITKQTLPKVFPYFNDYTFRGIFPDMKTRQNWIDFFAIFVK
jgi:hypothetical protein